MVGRGQCKRKGVSADEVRTSKEDWATKNGGPLMGTRVGKGALVAVGKTKRPQKLVAKRKGGVAILTSKRQERPTFSENLKPNATCSRRKKKHPR